MMEIKLDVSIQRDCHCLFTKHIVQARDNWRKGKVRSVPVKLHKRNPKGHNRAERMC